MSRTRAKLAGHVGAPVGVGSLQMWQITAAYTWPQCLHLVCSGGTPARGDPLRCPSSGSCSSSSDRESLATKLLPPWRSARFAQRVLRICTLPHTASTVRQRTEAGGGKTDKERMGSRALIVPFAFLALTSASPTAARATNPGPRALFVQKHPCPADGKSAQACSGYVITHVVPLCSGGRDLPSNMRWQPVAETQASVQEPHKLCHRTKAKQ